MGDPALRCLACPEGGRPIAVVGAGGKSAAIARLIGEWRDGAGGGAGMIATVTTRLKEEQALVADRVVYLAEDAEPPAVGFNVGPTESVLVVGNRLPELGKLDGVGADTVCRLAEENPDTPIVVEADGAAGALVKVPGYHEPVIPACAATVVVVTGFPALGRPIDRDAIHRYDRFVELFGEHVAALSPEIVAGLLRHPDGSFRGAPVGARRYWLINQVESEDAFRQAEVFADEVAARLEATGRSRGWLDRRIDGIIIGAVQTRQPLIFWPRECVTQTTEET